MLKPHELRRHGRSIAVPANRTVDLLRALAIPGRPAAMLGFLMLASALTEGVGLVLLGPMLMLLGSSQQSAVLGIPLTLGPLLALFVALVILRAAINLARNLAALSLETRLADNLRRRAWEALLHCDWRVLSSMRQSDNASLLISSIDRVGMGVNQFLAAASALVTLAGLSFAALVISPLAALGALCGGALVLLAYRRLRSRAAQQGEDLGLAYARVHGRLGEGLATLRVIKSLRSESAAKKAVHDGFANLADLRWAFQRDVGIGQSALQAGAALVLALLVWLAVSRWHLGAAAILPLAALFARAVPLVGALQEAWQYWSFARPAISTALALIDTTKAAREADESNIAAPCMDTAITLDNVTVQFAAAAAPALDGITLTIPAHGISALIGPSGSGKSTLADLLSGLLSPDNGRIMIDGTELDGPLRQAWRSRVAYVQQEPVLLAASIAENLRWAAPDASDAQLEAALRDAAAEFVFALPQGIETRVGDGGRALSGGERQRLMLARGLLREPSLLILDEATSALDPANEALITAALARLRGRMAVVIICHRGALLALADQVVRLESGRIVAMESSGGTG